MTKVNILNALAKLESSGKAAEIFKYKKTTSWVNVKNHLYYLSLTDDIKGSVKSNYFSKSGVYLFFLSFFSYLKLVLRLESKSLYIGAGSGLFEYNNETLDSYFPYSESKNAQSLYMLSAEHPDNLIHHHEYLKKNNIVIYSFLLAPLKIIFTKLFYRFSRLNIDSIFFEELENNGVSVTLSELSYIHTRFIVSFHLYKLFLLPLKVTKAFIVSAYSNSEIIAVLKEKNIDVVELQHGLIGSTHRAYNYQDDSQLLPTPNKVFVYNEFWKKELVNAGYYQNSQIKITGRLKYDLIQPKLKLHNKEFIVFTGQGGFYNEIISLFKRSNEDLLIKNIDLFYIPHPNETKRSIELLLKNIEEYPSISIIKHKQYTTEQYIYNCLHHISVYSSCHFDSIHYKQITYVFDVMKDNPMQYYVKKYPEQYKLIKNISEISVLEHDADKGESNC